MPMNNIKSILFIILLLQNMSLYSRSRITVRPEDFAGLTTSEKIASALNKLDEEGGGTIIFGKSPLYIIDRAIELPSRTKMIVDGCTIKLADKIFDNIIRSGNMEIDGDNPNSYVKKLTTAHDIHIIGKNGAVISGSDNFYSGINPKTGVYEKWEGDFWGWRNFSILFSNVRNFSIKGIRLVKTHSWGIVLTNGCKNGRVSEIDLLTTVKNGDGISIIQGGSNIVIKNITGSTSDDTIVLAAFDESRWSNEKYVFPLLPVRYSDYSYGDDIHDIRCENIHAAGKYHVMIFLPSRPQIYNVMCKNISDALPGGKNAIIRFYGNGQYGKGFKPGNMHDISLKGITSYKAYSVIEKFAPVMNLKTRNIAQKNSEGKLILNHVEKAPDITMHLSLPERGLYRIIAKVTRTDEDELKPGMMVPTRNATLQIGNGRKTTRIISDLDIHTGHCLGIFKLKKKQDIKIWMPEKVIFDSLIVTKYADYPVPDSVMNYIPEITPPKDHPRLWVTSKSLTGIRNNLNNGENAAAWAIVKNKALQPYYYHIDPSIEEFYNQELEDIAIIKAFYYLMTNDATIGKEAVRLMRDYYEVLEYGNVRRGDITREIGKSIYSAALVNDWCHNLITKEEESLFHDKMLQLARIMEVGWKPFKENAVNGHASEAQINRDLLSMAISIYDTDPEPYKYISYIVLERISKMRAFEYQSPRHNQGFDYGSFRHAWEMRAAWILRRMSGEEVFDDNITALRDYWLYMRLPEGDRFCDGDRFSHEGSFFPETLLLDYSYSGDTVLKGEFFRRGGMNGVSKNPVLFLLINDPSLGTSEISSLPLSLDYGDILGGMSSRTGWDLTATSNDVYSDIKGGGYHFGNHQHSDAGSFQIFFHGRLITDVGIYISYGTPYDFNFNKRSVSHNTVLVKDPNEPLVRGTLINEGGSRFVQRTPVSPEQVQSDPEFAYGKVKSVFFAPNKYKPCFSFFKADLSSAYSDKIEEYSRSYCFIDFKRSDVPAAIIVSDNVIMKDKFPSFWKVNSLSRPEMTRNGVKITSTKNGISGNAYIQNLLPPEDSILFELSSIKDSASILGPQYQIKYYLPEVNSYQVVEYSPNSANERRFLNIIFLTRDKTLPLPVDIENKDGYYHISVSDRIICMKSTLGLTEKSLTISALTASKIIISDLEPGIWLAKSENSEYQKEFNVLERSNSIYFEAPRGIYTITRVKESL